MHLQQMQAFRKLIRIRNSLLLSSCFAMCLSSCGYKILYYHCICLFLFSGRKGGLEELRIKSKEDKLFFFSPSKFLSFFRGDCGGFITCYFSELLPKFYFSVFPIQDQLQKNLHEIQQTKMRQQPSHSKVTVG